MMDAGWSGAAWWWMVVVMAIFWGLVAWVIVTVVRGAGRSVTRDAVSLLDERYARGEIDTEEYQTRREVLRG
jgi:putative membrane protein